METRESYRTTALPERPGREAESMRPSLVDARRAWADVVRAAWQAASVSVSMARAVGRVDAGMHGDRTALDRADQPVRHWRLRPRLTVRSAGEPSAEPLALRMLPPLG